MKSMTVFGAGLLIGMLLMLAIRKDRSAEISALRQEADKTAKVLEVTKQQLAKATASSDSVGLATPTANRAPDGKPKTAQKAGGIFNEKFAKAIQEMAQTQIKAQIESKLNRIIERLQLTPEQAARLRALVEPEIEGMVSQLKGAMSGNPAKPGASANATAIQLGTLPSQVEAMLAPDQKTAYEAYKQEEKTARIEARANAELMGLEAIGLSQEQKDKAYQIFCRLAEEDEGSMKEQLQGASSNPGEYFDRSMKRRLEALGAVLDEGQMKGYQSQVEIQRKMMSELGIGVETRAK